MYNELLYAEDEVAMSEAVVDILTYHKYTVDAVYNGEDAYGYAVAEKYDGIILDIMMPKMDGLEVLTKLREQGIHTPDVVHCGNICLDRNSYVLSNNNTQFPLSKLEFQFMELLMLNPGRLIIENSVESILDVPAENLFARFYRANSARTQKDGGYGIRLSAARAIVQIHGGKIEAAYIDTNRIRFVVEL